jgi:hypothetical protein
MTWPAFFKENAMRSSTGSGQGFGGFALDVRSFVAVNQIGLRGLVHGGSECAHGGAGGSFVTTRHGLGNFLAKRSDAALGGAVTFRAYFGLTNALLGRFGVGHGKKMTVVKVILDDISACAGREIYRFHRPCQEKGEENAKNEFALSDSAIFLCHS